MIKKRVSKRLLNPLILVFFFIYAVTPIGISVGKGAVFEDVLTTGGPPSIARNIRLFLLELVASGLSADGDAGQKADRKILLKKKRAVLSKGAGEIDQPLNALPSQVFRPEPKSGPEVLFTDAVVALRTEFVPLFSGLSPPRLS
jgi:hypothetical protein